MRTRTLAVSAGRLGCTMVWLGLICGTATAESPPKEPKVELRGFLELKTREVVMGEPLVVTASLRNVGEIRFVTTYARPGIFRGSADVDFTVTTAANAVIPTPPRRQSGGVVYQLHPDIIKKMGDRAPAIKPGEAVGAKRTVPLVRIVDDRWVWLQPGTYKIQAKIRIQSGSEDFMTAVETFTVKPLAPEDQGVLSIFTPDLAGVLQRDFVRTEKAAAKAVELRQKFPRAQHRQYLDFHLLWAVPTREEQLAKANAYLEEFPKSPYVDDVLLNLARMEREADKYEKAAAHLETLLRDYPDSPLKQEAEELQTKMKQARDRAAVRKAAKEKNAALEGKPAPSEDNGAGPP